MKSKPQKVWVLSDADFATCEVFADRKSGETFMKENFAGDLERVKKTESVITDEGGEVIAILIQKTVKGDTICL